MPGLVFELKNWKDDAAPVLELTVERVDKLTFYVQKDPVALALFSATVEPGWLVTVKRKPQGVGTQQTFTAHVYGITHRIDGSLWTVTLDLSAARTGYSWFTWGTDTWGGAKGWAF